MSLNSTDIETTDFSWNPKTGCFHRCKYCYARKKANHWLRKIYLANEHIVESKRHGNPEEDPFWPRFWKDRLSDPKKVLKNFRSRNPNLPLGSAMIFTVDMGDLFGPWVPEEWVNDILDVTKQYKQHIFQFLTKSPQTLKKYKFPRNAWVGTTVTKPDDLIRINILATQCEASTKYVYFEPLLGDIFPENEFLLPTLTFLDWMIVGAMTGSGRKKHFPKVKWVNNVIDAARTYQIPLFIKDNLLFLDDEPTGIEKIQEFPIVKNEAGASLKKREVRT